MQEHRLPESLSNFQSLEAMVAKDGSRRVYGVNEAGKKKQIAGDAVLAAYGYVKRDAYDEPPAPIGNPEPEEKKIPLHIRQYQEARENFEQKYREIIHNDLVYGSGYADDSETSKIVESLLQIELQYFDEEAVYDIASDRWTTPAESDMKVREDLDEPKTGIYDHKKSDPELHEGDEEPAGLTILQRRLKESGVDEYPDVPAFVSDQSESTKSNKTENESSAYSWIPLAAGSLAGTSLDRETDGKSVKKNPWYKRMWGEKYRYDDGYSSEDLARDEAEDREILPFPNTVTDIRSGKREQIPVEDYEVYETVDVNNSEEDDSDNHAAAALVAGAAGIATGAALASNEEQDESEENEDTNETKRGLRKKHLVIAGLIGGLLAAGALVPQFDNDDPSQEDTTEQTADDAEGSEEEGPESEETGTDESAEEDDDTTDKADTEDDDTKPAIDDQEDSGDDNEETNDDSTDESVNDGSGEPQPDDLKPVDDSQENTDKADTDNETSDATNDTGTAEKEQLNLENAVGIENFKTEVGSGFVKEIKDFAQANNVEISNDQAFAMYQAMLDTLGPNGMITGPTYEISPGNIGISNPGANTWTDEAAKFIIDRLPIEQLPETQ